MAKKKLAVQDEQTPNAPAPARGLVAYADFDLNGKQVKEGEVFTPPAGWVRDEAQEELVLASKRKNGATAGVVFRYPGAVVNPDAKPEHQYRETMRVTLPLKEQ